MGYSFYAPEIIQISPIDCGPAALKCWLAAHGCDVRYQPLRDLCQTEVDGTSIDTVEQTCAAMGVPAMQLVMPIENLLSCDGILPVIYVQQHPNSPRHFAVLWRTHGPVLQVMDPMTGRHWIRRRAFVDTALKHTMRVSREWWRAVAADAQLTLDPLRNRCRKLGLSRLDAAKLRDYAAQHEDHCALVDAALRMTETLSDAGDLRKKASAQLLWDLVRSPEKIPAEFRFARSCPDAAGEVEVSGCVVLVRDEDGEDDEYEPSDEGGAVNEISSGHAPEPEPPENDHADETVSRVHLDRLLGKEVQPLRALWSYCRKNRRGLLPIAALFVSVGGAAEVARALVFRGLIDMWSALPVLEQRIAALGATLLFLALVFAIGYVATRLSQMLAREVEIRIRAGFLAKLARLGDRYLHSRPISDLAHRAHFAHELQLIPLLFGDLLQSLVHLTVIVVLLAVIDLNLLPIAALAAGTAIAIPLCLRAPLQEAGLRSARHSAVLGRFVLDAVLGVAPVRAHGGDRALRIEHDRQLGRWRKAFMDHQKLAILLEGVQLTIGYGFAAWLIWSHYQSNAQRGALLLVVFWALQIPVLVGRVVAFARTYPSVRGNLVRLLEPLHSLDAGHAQGARVTSTASHASAEVGVGIELEHVQVRAAGRSILHDLTLSICPGEHVAVIGPSGAGKSSLLSVVLGLREDIRGQVAIDGQALKGAHLDRIRERAVWVDPQVHLWNKPLADNVCYGNGADPDRLGTIVRDSDLTQCIARLDEGMQTHLGDGGSRLSGGEGQRVRLARAFFRDRPRLVVLDEPFRGLERTMRRTLFERARRRWSKATLLFATHDISDTKYVDRVLVVEDGRIVENGHPLELLAGASRYKQYFDGDVRAMKGLWQAANWQRLSFREGRLVAW